MAYTTINKPSDYFNTILYTGDNSSPRTITGVGFQPDMNWSKIRSESNDHWVSDAVRGANKIIRPNGTDDELVNGSGGYISSFNSDGYVIASGSANNNNFNKSSGTMVSWNWKAGTSFTNDASGTGIGSIDSAGSFNNDSGFSIVSYTGTGTAGTIKHGLSTAPSMIIAKMRNSAEDWGVYHKSLGASKYINLNTTNAVESSTSRWNGVEPTSSVFSVNNHAAINGSSNTYIAYCFAEKKGFSKFGSYTGVNSITDNSFIYLGFSPAWVMIKKTNGTNDWGIFDNKRNSFNPTGLALDASNSNAESVNGTIDMLSNGFKVRSDSGLTGDGEYIYMAFAEAPLVGSNNVPCTAR